jgi:hypothetical protein
MVPSSLFLGLALGSMAVSAFLKISGKKQWALFVGQWHSSGLVPTFCFSNRVVNTVTSDKPAIIERLRALRREASEIKAANRFYWARSVHTKLEWNYTTDDGGGWKRSEKRLVL